MDGEVDEDENNAEIPEGEEPIGVAYNIEHADIAHATFVTQTAHATPQQIENMERKFIDGVNNRSSRNGQPSIMKGYGGEFEEPRNEVEPKLTKTNFYRGGGALDEVEYSIVKERGRLTAREKKREVEVPLNGIHTHGRYIALVGGAGSGKTTLLKRYCIRVLNGRIECMKEIKFIHLINIKDWSLKDGKFTPKEILFSVFNLASNEVVTYGFDWLKKPENQKITLFLLDGLDTAPWVLREEYHHNMINYDDKATIPVIIYNILCGNLFPYIKILLTSREYGMSRFSEEIRPDATIALRGLSKVSIKTLVTEIGGNRGDFIWESMLKKSLKLMLLCNTPLFLIFVIIVYLHGDEVPDTLSGLIMTILTNHLRSKHRKTKANVPDIIEKLMELSLDGIKRARVVFSKADFDKFGLTVSDVKDLVISVPNPGSNVICDQNLLEEDYSFFFVHQTVQELLAASEIAKLELTEFKMIIDNNIHTPKYGVVRQMLCGVVFNEEIAKLNIFKKRVEGQENRETQNIDLKKQEYLIESMRKELNDGNISPTPMLNMLICLSESGEDGKIIHLIKTSIKKIILSGIPLTTSDMHAVGSVTSNCEKISIMALDNCQLKNHDLEVLSNALGTSPVEITVFDVCFNRSLRKNSMSYLHKICIRGQGLNYWQCGFRQIDILNFDERTAERVAIERGQVSEEQQILDMFNDQNTLDLSDHNTAHYFNRLQELIENDAKLKEYVNVSLTEYETKSNLTNLCKLLGNCHNIGEFKISECEFSEKQLDDIMKAIPSQEITMVNVFLTPSIEAPGWKKIGEITKKFKANNLAITACSLTQQKLLNLRFAIDKSQIHRFDMSRNKDMDESCLKQAGTIVHDCNVNELIMGYCGLTSEKMRSLKTSLRYGNGAAPVHKIDLSGNDEMGEDGYSELGQIVDLCDTKELDISECDPSPQEMRSFKESTHTAEITKLNVSRNRRMGEWGLNDVGELVGRCKLKNLFVRQCELEEKTLRSFAKGMGNAKIEHLDFGLYFMKPRETTEAEIKILQGLLPNITRELTLNAWSFGRREREFEQMLQQQLNELPFIEPGVRIMFDRGQQRYIQQERQ